MTKTLLAGAACLALLAACNDRGASPAVDGAQDAASVPVGQTSATVMGGNMASAYIPNAAMGDMYEIQAANIALERSTNADVKALATEIKADHTMAAEKLKSLAPTAAPDVEIPTELDERRQGLIDNLRSASAADFDEVYVNQQVAAHQEAVTLQRGFGDNTDTPTLAAHAREVLPKIEAHLQKARALDETL